MEATENKLGFQLEPIRLIRVPGRLLERFQLITNLYMEALGMKAKLKERRERVTTGVLLGTPVCYKDHGFGTRSFVFETPVITGIEHKYVVLTLDGRYKTVTFTPSAKNGEYINASSYSETSFKRSLQKVHTEYDPTVPYATDIYDFLGHGIDHIGRQTLTSADPDKKFGEGTIFFQIDDTPATDQVIESALNSLELSSLDSR